jgi:hypothetical protein
MGCHHVREMTGGLVLLGSHENTGGVVGGVCVSTAADDFNSGLVLGLQ